MKYDVDVDGKEYLISVKPVNEEHYDQSVEITEFGADIAFEAAKEEYEYCIHRSEKLDNKIYILLTVCAFFATMQMDLIQKIFEKAIPPKYCCLIWSGFGIELGSFLLAVILLVMGLWSITLKRVDPSIILKKDMVYAENKRVAKYICGKYTQCSAINNKLISKRYKISNAAIVLITAAFILIFVLRLVLSQFPNLEV